LSFYADAIIFYLAGDGVVHQRDVAEAEGSINQAFIPTPASRDRAQDIL